MAGARAYNRAPMFVLADKYGQLGNRLVLSAHLLAAALEHGHGFANLALEADASSFEAVRDDLLCRFPPMRSAIAPRPWLRWVVYRLVRRLTHLAAKLRLVPPGVALVHHRSVDVDWPLDGPELARLARTKRIVFFRGWMFREPALLARHADAVRRAFALVPERRARLDALLAGVRARADVVVGVHVRRGDYRTFQGGRWFFELSAYARLMARTAALFPGRRVAFLVCSDEQVRPEDFPGVEAVMAGGDPVDDLYALARCDRLVGPPSTFTAWASFYGRVPLFVFREADATPALDAFAPALSA